VNGQDAVSGLTVMSTSEEAPVMTAAADLDCSADGDNHRITDSQSSSTDPVYDLHIHNQTLLWKVQPKPPYNNQVVILSLFIYRVPSYVMLEHLRTCTVQFW